MTYICRNRRTVTSSCCLTVHGNWSAWASWTSCSRTCGLGAQTRTRSCTNPSPAHGGHIIHTASMYHHRSSESGYTGDDCTGSAADYRSCRDGDCPPGTLLFVFFLYFLPVCLRRQSILSIHLSVGLSTRLSIRLSLPVRVCSVFNPTTTETELLLVDGSWALWSSWTSCSDTCGGGTQIRIRSCTNPAPSNGGQSCSGSNTDRQDCNSHSCPSGSPQHRLQLKFCSVCNIVFSQSMGHGAVGDHGVSVLGHVELD